MKRISVLFSACILLLTTGCHQKEKRAKQYHDNILQSVQLIIDGSLDYADGIQRYEKTSAIETHQKYSALVNNTFSVVEKANDFEGDTTLIYFSKELLGFYKKTLNEEFAPFLNSVKSTTFSEEEKQVADSLITNLTTTESKYWDRFNWAEKKFYKEENIGKVEK